MPNLLRFRGAGVLPSVWEGMAAKAGLTESLALSLEHWVLLWRKLKITSLLIPYNLLFYSVFCQCNQIPKTAKLLDKLFSYLFVLRQPDLKLIVPLLQPESWNYSGAPPHPTKIVVFAHIFVDWKSHWSSLGQGPHGIITVVVYTQERQRQEPREKLEATLAFSIIFCSHKN